MKLNRKGFSVVEVLLVIIALTLIVFVGFYVMNAGKDSKKTETASTVSNNSQEKPAEKPQKKYLEIKEEGVKFELSDKISDAYYSKDKFGNINFSVQQFDSDPGLDGCKADNGGILYLVAAKPGDISNASTGEAWTEADLKQSGMKQVGDTWYGFMKSGMACYDKSSAQADEYSQKVDSIRSDFLDTTSTFTKI